MWCVCLTKVQSHGFFFTGIASPDEKCAASSFLFCLTSLFSLCVCDLSLNRSAFVYMYLLSTSAQVSCVLIFPKHKAEALFRVYFSYKGSAEIRCEVNTRWLYLTEKPVIVSVTEGSVYLDVQDAVKRQSLPDLFSWKEKSKIGEGDTVRTVFPRHLSDLYDTSTSVDKYFISIITKLWFHTLLWCVFRSYVMKALWLIQTWVIGVQLGAELDAEPDSWSCNHD